tara:strand:- start:1310 stop:1645 length:336 start_codon:yes stop_codon:yes gene_type:complete
MPTPNYHNYTSSILSQDTFVEHQATEPGEYNAAEVWNGGELTGIWGGMMKSGSATAIEHSAILTSANGVNIPLNAFKSQTFYEVGITSISGSDDNGGGVYLFKRRRNVERK